MSPRTGLIVALLLMLALAARGDGIWSGGGDIGQDGIANKNAVGINGLAAINAVATSGGGSLTNCLLSQTGVAIDAQGTTCIKVR